MNQVFPFQGFSPVFIEDHSNPEADKFKKSLNKEIEIQAAELKVKILSDKMKSADLTKVQKNVLTYELQDAQREFANLKNQNNIR